MKIIYINDEVKIENKNEYAVCLGMFDGVHIGHRELINKTVTLAKEKALKSAVLTFLRKKEKNKIYPLETKIKLIEKMGIDTVFIIDFDKKFMEKSPEEFIREYLIDYIRAKEIVCGFNYRFGKNRIGDFNTLKDYEKLGYNLTVIEPVLNDGEVVSSTLIKKLLTEGNIKRANLLLGRDYLMEGIVKEGNKIGRTIKFPTVNVPVPCELIRVKAGVYASYVKIGNKKYYGLSNIGTAPTVRKSEEFISETYIINFSDDLYNKNVKIYLKEFIREERKFSSIEELKETICENLKTAEELFEKEL